MKKFLIFAILLSSCTSTSVHEGTQKRTHVEVPDSPTLPISALKKGSTPATVVKAFVASIYIQQQHVKALKNLLSAF